MSLNYHYQNKLTQKIADAAPFNKTISKDEQIATERFGCSALMAYKV